MMYKKQSQMLALHKLNHKRQPSARSQMYGLSGMMSMFFIALIWMRAISVGHQAFNLIATTDLIQDNDVMDAYVRLFRASWCAVASTHR
jgi:hypothetical protein